VWLLPLCSAQAELACLGAGTVWVKSLPFSLNFFDSKEEGADVW